MPEWKYRRTESRNGSVDIETDELNEINKLQHPWHLPQSFVV